ncbi:hypothetical protein EH31_07555 [Erythrobacter longus]|uniref:Glycosyltransferase 2-like domain-containing protein n=1 Tax=Erythrobacter longus TaxID=1044 RepID=A0A074MBQ2_ERYLO|nr:glycosyltransferase family 2 protein [Erythrobacter longus]KEO90884.1 hypothetical protein EH31_07555 [Erythrobacter longus]
MPEITVLMGVHNGEQFLAQTLASVAAQTFEDYEFVIVDDASGDSTPQILECAAADDPRIRVLTNEGNIGLTRSLNRGLGEARGEFVARIDADDVCMSERLEKQLSYMRKNPACVGVTSGYIMIDAMGRELGRTVDPLDDWQIRWLLGWNPPAPHPTYFFKRCPDGKTPIFYDERFRTAQDFDLWGRLAALGPTHRLSDPLVKYRRHDGAITHSKRYEQAQNCAEIGHRNLSVRLPQEVVEKLNPLIEMFAYNTKANGETVKAAAAGVNAMLAHDLPNARLHGRWVMRMTAGLLADAILSRGGGLSSPKAVSAFLWHARWLLLPLAGAVLSDPGTAFKSLKNRKRA